MLDYLAEAVRRCAESRYRLLVYFPRDKFTVGLLRELFASWAESRGRNNRVLLAYRDYEDPAASLVRGALAELAYLELSEVKFKDSAKLLGSSWDGLVLDITRQLKPNDLGILIEMVRGGGLVVIIGPSAEGLDSWSTEFHRELAVYPYGEGDVKKRFEARMLRKTSEMGVSSAVGTVIGEQLEFVEEGENGSEVGAVFHNKLYELCLSVDEARVLRSVEALVERRANILVLRANRGRGKSAALGLATAGLMTLRGRKKKRYRAILVTSPEPSNVQTFFEFVVRGLEELGIRPRIEERDGSIVAVKVSGCSVFYKKPINALRAWASIAIVDEAAAIPVSILLQIRRTFRQSIFSSTIHGYEGAGRGFTLRFLKRIRETYKGSLLEVEMETPIRYAPGDPVERWLYDVLLLDAEPAKLGDDEADLRPGDCEYKALSRDELFSYREDLLRQLWGIYVLTHYRNRPDDLAMLGDAPHHDVRALITPSGKPIAALQICVEGGLQDDMLAMLEEGTTRGHLIPATIARYYPEQRRLGRLRGVRIVRIAVHPDLWGRGFGSYILGMLERELRDKGGVEWMGSGFGASAELLRFWIRNGYFPVHVGPTRNPVSGEYGAVVVKPLSEAAEEVLASVSLEFRQRFVDSLADSYFSMEKDIVWLILSRTIGFIRAEPSLTKSQRLRLDRYLKRLITYEGAADSVRQLVRAHFLTSVDARVRLDERVEKFLIMKTLQGRPWLDVAKYLRVKVGDQPRQMRETIAILAEAYL